MASHPAVFLAGETRQVWARHRETGAPVYLPEGQADAMRAYTRAHLRCLYPGCDARLSTRGGSRRDGFFHVGSVPHETGRETENHLAAKAMLGEWLTERVPDGSVVEVEKGVRMTSSARDRRPDVLATGRTGRRVAYEIEYKTWATAEWREKQSDLESEGIVCLWLIGHTRLASIEGTAEVRVPDLFAAVAQHGVPLLAINPVTREVGTLTRAGTDDEPYTGRSSTARLHVDALNDCRFSSVAGLRTPAMLVIEEGERRRAAIEADRQRQREQWALTWTASAVRNAFAQRWTEVPDLLFGRSFPEQWRGTVPAIAAPEKHWRGAIYEDLILANKEPFRIGQALDTLDAHGIAVDRDQAGPLIHNFLRHMSEIGLVAIRDRKRRYSLRPQWEITPTGRDLDSAVTSATFGSRGQGRDGPPMRMRDTPEYKAALEARRRTKQITLPDGTTRWVRK